VKHLRESFPLEQLNLAVNNENKSTKEECIAIDEALSMLTNADLTKYQYEVIRETLKRSGFNILPTYKKVLEAKKECYPSGIKVTESKAEIDLQNLLDHTVKRIFQSFDEKTVSQIDKDQLVLISKWGCDGTSGQSEFKQKFSENTSNVSDTFMYLVSTVPIQLVSSNNSTKQLWINSRPSSPRLCRPIQFEFAKEIPELIRKTVEYINYKISTLYQSTVIVFGRTFQVKHNLVCTMIDGKTAQCLTDTKSSATCYICKATPREMNDLNRICKKLCNDNALELGLSPLHARIKFMECILHVAYNLSFKKWSTNKETKVEKEENKKRIQQEFQSRTGLRIDMVRQGYGNTNDGNTSRRFFSHPEITSDITGINVDLIKRFSTILEVITCGAAIDPEKFGVYAYDTAKLFVNLYGWHYMPVTVYKVLLHGQKIINAAVLPIGLLSEEAQEAQNKNYKNCRVYHSRKISRIATNEDVLHQMLMSSDPYIFSLKKGLPKDILSVNNDAKTLLQDEQ
jgi:hypothetical protein